MRNPIQPFLAGVVLAWLLGGCGHTGIEAARRGDIAGLKSWLAEGAKVDSRGAQQRTALHAAAVAGQPEVIRWLIAQGADPDAVDEQGETALCLIMKPEKSPAEAAVARALAESGADVNKPCGDGQTPMAHASRHYKWDALLPLLEKGAKTQQDYAKADEPLCRAALSARADVVALMLENGEDPNEHGGAAIFDALNTSQKDSWEVVKLLVENGIDLKFKQKGDGTGDTALHRVVLLRNYGSARIVDIMVRHGADPYAVNRNQDIPLDTALAKSTAIAERMVKHMALELPAAEPLKLAYDKMVMAAAPGDILQTIERMMAAAGYVRVQSRLMRKGEYNDAIKEAPKRSMIRPAAREEAEIYRGLVTYARALVGALANAAAENALDSAKARENFENLMTTIVGDTRHIQQKRHRMGAGASPAVPKVLAVVELLRKLETTNAK